MSLERIKVSKCQMTGEQASEQAREQELRSEPAPKLSLHHDGEKRRKGENIREKSCKRENDDLTQEEKKKVEEIEAD